MFINMMSYLTHFAGRLFIFSLTRLEYIGTVVTLLFHCLLPMDGGRHFSRDTHARWAFFILGMTLMQILMNNVSSIYKLHLLSRPSILLIAPSSSSIRYLRHDSEYIVHVPGRGYHVRLVDEAIEELNQRFQEHHIGYQFQHGELIKLTDQYLHEEVMLPALTLLTGPQFRGAQDEFLSAHRHYREQRYKEAVADALKAFESTMKSILNEREWRYDRERDTARNLLQFCLTISLFLPCYKTSLPNFAVC